MTLPPGTWPTTGDPLRDLADYAGTGELEGVVVYCNGRDGRRWKMIGTARVGTAVRPDGDETLIRWTERVEIPADTD